MDAFESIRDWLVANGPWLGPVSSLLSLFGILLAWRALRPDRDRYIEPPLGEILNDPANYRKQIDEWRCGRHQGYLNAIQELRRFADDVYGPARSWRALNRCMTLALIYPILAAFLGWVLFNSHSPGGLSLFRDIDSIWVRMGFSIVTTLGFGLAIWIARNTEKFADFFVDKLFGPIDMTTPRTGFLPKAVRGVVDFVAFAVAGAVAVAVAFAFAVAVAVAFAFAGAFAFAFAVAGDLELASLFVFFYVLLPILNALADWISLWITRHFLAKVDAEQSTGQLLTRCALDLGFALLCLAALLTLITFSLLAWEALSPATVPLRPTEYWAEIRAAPEQGMALYMMIATTLLPTFVHFGTGLWALFAAPGRLLATQIAVLEQAVATGEPLNDLERRDMIRAVRRAEQARRVVPWIIGFILTGLFLYPLVALTLRAF